MAGRTALAAAFTRCINGLLGKQRSACIPVLKELLRLHVRTLAALVCFNNRCISICCNGLHPVLNILEHNRCAPGAASASWACWTAGPMRCPHQLNTS